MTAAIALNTDKTVANKFSVTIVHCYTIFPYFTALSTTSSPGPSPLFKIHRRHFENHRGEDAGDEVVT